MSSVFRTLTDICLDNLDSNCRVYRNFDQLTPGTYKIDKFALVETRFGLKLQAITDKFFIYLPSRFSNKINEQAQIDELNANRCLMIYKGKNENGVKLEFKQYDNNVQGYSEDEEESSSQTSDTVSEYNINEAPMKLGAKRKRIEKWQIQDEVDGDSSKKSKKLPKNKKM